MISKYCIVISYDAFSKDNWESAKTKPNMANLLVNGASTSAVKSVYPTLTYVVHSSYVTGAYPNKHGVFHNNPFQPFVAEQDQNWHWYRSDMKLPTVYEAVCEQGMTTASILWPVTGKANIHFNIPEMKAVKNENQALKILKNGSRLFTLSMEMKFGRLRKGIEQPYLDDFITACSAETIKKKQPNLLMLHLIDLDDTKHLKGTKGDHIEEVITRMDRRLGEIVKAVEDAGIKDETTFIIVGDHGQLDVQYKVYLNRLLKDAGLIYEEAGEWHWRAYVQGAGGAAYLHVKPGDAEAEIKALHIIREASERVGIEAIYDRTQLDLLHVAKEFQYKFEAKAGYAFEDDIHEDLVVDLQALGKVYATHGYSPNKPDYTSNLIISGTRVKSGYDIGRVEVVDVGPTIAHILGVDFHTPDGRALMEVFR